MKSGVVLELKNSSGKSIFTCVIGLDFHIGEKSGCPLLNFVFAFLEVLYFGEEDILKIFDVSGFRCLLNFEEFVIDHCEGGKFGAKLLSPDL